MFFYTYSYLVRYPDVIATPLTAGALLLVLLVLLYLSTPQPVPDFAGQPIKLKALRDSVLNARLSLYQMFWPFWLCLNALIFLADTLVKAGIMTVLLWDIVHLNLLMFSLLWASLVWRVSGHTGRRIWAALARFTVILSVLEFMHRLVIRIQYPREYFDCRELFLNFTSCF